MLGNHHIFVLAPANLNLEVYKKKVNDFEVIFIPANWQSSVLNYNKLKLSRFFYRLFADFEYLLTYELDAFVFKDELNYWCQKRYDYIGAPWFDFRKDERGQIFGVGNSGFSLRRIDTIKKILKSYFFKNPLTYERGNTMLVKAYIRFPYEWLRNRFNENYTIQKFCQINEDQFFCDIVPKRYKDFKIAPIRDAISFSFEANPRQLFELNGNNLPMGCHAWWRYDLQFWKPFIEDFGYTIE